jgi:hypothetical protein
MSPRVITPLRAEGARNGETGGIAHGQVETDPDAIPGEEAKSTA